MQTWLKHTSVYLILLFLPYLAGAEKYVHFDRFMVENGLSSNLVNDIDQDTSGHLWFATDYGVSRYDGHSFRRYVNEEDPSLLRNDISKVRTYSDGSVFFCGQQGVILRYDKLTDTFRDVSPLEFNHSYYKSVEGFSISQKGIPYVYTSGGFYRYDVDSMRFDEHIELFEKWKNHYVVSLYEDVRGRFWVGSFNSLKIISAEGELIKQIDLSQDDAKPMFSAKMTIVDDRHVLVTFFSDLIYSFTLGESEEIAESELIRLPFSNVNHVLCDRMGHFWYTTDGDGLWYSEGYPSKLTDFQKVVPTDGKVKELQKLYTIKECRNGDLWIATHSSGAWRCRPNQQQSFVPSADILYTKQMGSSFSEDGAKNIYVTCDGGGLSRISPDRSSIIYFDEKNGLTSRNVVCHTRDQNDHLWLATWGGGLLDFDPQTERFRQEKFLGIPTHLSCFSYVTSLSNGELWVSTGGDGLYVRDTLGKWRRELLKFGDEEYDMWPFKIAEGTNGSRWIATSRSLWRVQSESQKPLLGDFSKLRDHNPLHLNDVFVMADGMAFVATDRCVLCFSEDGLTCDTLQYLPNASYSSLNSLEDGILLASSSEGILRIDYKKRLYSQCAYDVRKNGKNYFRAHSSFLASDGTMYWGTREGFVMQRGMDQQQKMSVESFQISDVRSGELTLLEMGRFLRRRENGSISSVSMPHDRSDLRIKVDLVEYTEQEKVLKYRLNGFSDKWMSVPDNREIAFSYLPSGDYQLEVVLEDDTDRRVLSLDVCIQTPWWRQWWFITLALFSVLALIAAAVLLRMRRMERQRRELERMVELRTKELDEKNLQIGEQNEELRHVLADKDRVLSVIAHDLKNPMFAIVGALEGWVRREPMMESQEKRSIIENVLNSSQTLQMEMGRLLEWARAKNEKIDYNPTAVDIAASMANVKSLLSSLLDKKKIVLSITGTLQHCAWADSRMVSTIFRNFINNAIKFTPENGQIRVALEETQARIRVRIEDNGVGMTQEQLVSLQTHGYTQSTLGTENEKGTGLGFRICKDYVEKNSGTLSVESEVGKGTTIVMEFLPAEKSVEELVPTIKDKVRLDEVIDRPMLEGNTVVVVDDDALICQNVANILKEYMEVLTASNGEEALRLVEERQVDLVLSDVEMPVMNGIEFSRRLESNEATNAIPVLFLSAKNEESDRLMGLLSGAVDYIAKPFSSSELLMKINNLLRLRQLQQIRLMKQHYFEPENKKTEGASSVEKDKPKPEKVNPFVEKVMQELSQHYAESGFSIEMLASSVNVSQSTLTRKLKSMVNKTPIELLNEYRLNRALLLLKDETNDESIAEVAYEVGFSDPAYFTRKFKDFYGYLPSSVKE